MNPIIRIRTGLTAMTAASVLIFAPVVHAQDIAPSHLNAAYVAIDAIHATDAYDEILAGLAEALKNELIQKDPNLQPLISATVDQKTLQHASRRGDLEREAALVYAKTFTEAELVEIGTFYNSPTGQKLIESGPIVSREISEAATIWQRGLARDIAVDVSEEMKALDQQKSDGTASD